MNFIDKMIAYYQGESGHGGFLIGAGGLSLLLLAVFTWRFANPLSLLRGFTIPLMIGGLFLGIAGMASGYYTKKTFTEKLKVYQQDRKSFFKAERAKVEKIHTSWRGVRIGWTLVALSGLAMWLLVKKDFLLGIGLGILLFGLIGHVVEAFSFFRNEKYHKAVIEAVQQETAGRIGPSVKIQPLPVERSLKQAKGLSVNNRLVPAIQKPIEKDQEGWTSKADSLTAPDGILNTGLINPASAIQDDQVGDATIWQGSIEFPGPYFENKPVHQEKLKQHAKDLKKPTCWLAKRFGKR